MVAEGQVPPDELAADALEEFRNGFLTIFRLSQHAFDGVRSETPARDVDRHGISPCKEALLAQFCGHRTLSPRPLRIQETVIGGHAAGRNNDQFSPNSGATFPYAVRLSGEQCRSSVIRVGGERHRVRTRTHLKADANSRLGALLRTGAMPNAPMYRSK